MVQIFIRESTLILGSKGAELTPAQKMEIPSQTISFSGLSCPGPRNALKCGFFPPPHHRTSLGTQCFAGCMLILVVNSGLRLSEPPVALEDSRSPSICSLYPDEPSIPFPCPWHTDTSSSARNLSLLPRLQLAFLHPARFYILPLIVKS